MAALHLMAQVDTPLLAVTVDHALRAEAAQEAAFVAATCADLGLSHHILRWDHGAILGNVQDQARQARYRLITDWAQAQGVSHVVLGHTADDQAETFLMGLARGAGLDGLIGMRPKWRSGEVTFLRPFLGQSRADLRGFLAMRGLRWVEDPSNDNDLYTRVKARKALISLEPLGVSVAQLNTAIGNLALAHQALDRITRDAMARIVEQKAGALSLTRAGWLGEDAEVQRRMLIAGLRWVASADYAPRAAAVQRALQAISAGRGATLWGCRIKHTCDRIWLLREPRAVADLRVATTQIWDGRWQVTGPHAPDLHIRALGSEGLRQCKNWRETGLGRDMLLVSPAIWRENALISAPLAGFGTGWAARIASDFANL